MEYVPYWARVPCENGKYYAPQFRTDREWYENTKFPEESEFPFPGTKGQCYTTDQTWPLGLWLDEAYCRS